jgi:predicted NAD/FAD-binding protein
MNDLQSISSQKHGHLFATLNPLNPPSPTRVLGHYAYSHPVLSTDSVRAQHELALLNSQATAMTTTGPEPERSGRHRVFAGAWTRYGFHEDGFASGLRAAAALPGIEPPFRITDADIERGEPFITVMPVARLFDVLEVVRAFTALLVGRVLLVVFGAIGPVERKKVD